jgi:hypothetical protein
MTDALEGAYPRPQLCRENWRSLDGEWHFALHPRAVWTDPQYVAWNRHIVVPFAPETEASAVNETGFFRACWYRHLFAAPPLSRGERLLLHFGAVDYVATVWCNDWVADATRAATPRSQSISHRF